MPLRPDLAPLQPDLAPLQPDPEADLVPRELGFLELERVDLPVDLEEFLAGPARLLAELGRHREPQRADQEAALASLYFVQGTELEQVVLERQQAVPERQQAVLERQQAVPERQLAVLASRNGLAGPRRPWR